MELTHEQILSLTPYQIMSMDCFYSPPMICPHCSRVHDPPDDLAKHLNLMPTNKKLLDQWIRKGLTLCTINSEEWMCSFAHETLNCLGRVKWAKEQYASDSDALEKLDSILLELAKCFSRFPPDRRMCMCVRDYRRVTRCQDPECPNPTTCRASAGEGRRDNQRQRDYQDVFGHFSRFVRTMKKQERIRQKKAWKAARLDEVDMLTFDSL